MSMATPTLISTVFYLNWANLRSSYTTLVCYAYTNFYYFLSQFGKSTLILHYVSMATPSLCSTLLYYYYAMRQIYTCLLRYEYGDTYAHLDPPIIWVRQVYPYC